MTDVNVKEDDKRVNRAFEDASQNLPIKADEDAVDSSDTAKQQVRLSFVAVFVKL